MRISTTQLTLLLMVFVTVACTPSATSPVITTAVSTSELAPMPDLIIKLMYLEMEGRQSNCVEAYTPYGIRVLVENIGLASAGPFVVDLNGVRQQVDGGLAAGKSIELHFTGTTPSGQYEAFADVTDQVVEQQEDNNSLSYLAPTPTPPPLCPATPTLTP
jgi:subtilase family serine protease